MTDPAMEIGRLRIDWTGIFPLRFDDGSEIRLFRPIAKLFRRIVDQLANSG